MLGCSDLAVCTTSKYDSEIKIMNMFKEQKLSYIVLSRKIKVKLVLIRHKSLK